MNRRDTLLALIALGATPLASFAQPARPRPLVGWLAGASQVATASFVRAFLDGMRERGYADGQNFGIAYRFADGYVDRLPALAAELIQLKPDVIVAAASANAVAVKKLTTTIPIVVPALGDAIALGLIASEAKPGGNVTGVAPYVNGLPGKQLEIAREVVPGATRIGLLNDATDVKAEIQRQEIESAGAAFGLRISNAAVRRPEDIDATIQKLAREQVQVLIVLQTNMFLSARKQIADSALAHRMPTVNGYSQHVDAGGLISYGVNLPACFRLAATYVDKILRGARPGELPVEFPSRLEMAVNLKTAKALGMKLPQSLIVRVDTLVE
jgi:putative ABC transport system substrate-binding protein